MKNIYYKITAIARAFLKFRNFLEPFCGYRLINAIEKAFAAIALTG